MAEATRRPGRFRSGTRANRDGLTSRTALETDGAWWSLPTETLPACRSAGCGDLITTLDDVRVESMVDLAAQMRSRQTGDEVTVRLLRGGDQVDLDVALGVNG